MKLKKIQIQIMDTVYCSPILPARVWAQCRCGGHSPRRHFMVWPDLLSALSLFPAEPAPMQTRGRPVGFPIAVGQGYLVIFKRASWWINTCVPTFWSPFITFFPLKLSFLRFWGKVHVDEKGPTCNGAIQKNLWMSVIHGADRDEDCGARGTAAASQETV